MENHFTQHIFGYDGNTVGFTFEEFMAEIDAGRQHKMVSVIRLGPSPGIFQDGFESGDASRWYTSTGVALRIDAHRVGAGSND